ncbi:MAG: carbohydrate ABC transporter permease [Candidatus Micrarchaeaceae archaeon]
MLYRKKFQSFLFKVITILMAVIFMIPIFYAISSSFKTNSEIYSYPPTILPKVFSVQGYQYIFQSLNFVRVLYNTLFVSIIATVITVIISIMAGYAIAKGNFKGKKLISNLMIMMVFVSIGVTLVPVFIIVKEMNLLNNLWGIIIPTVFTPTGTFIAIQYMKGIPDEFIESAKIDGATEWQIFSRIIFPLSFPLAAVLTIFSFTWRWGDFVLPLIVISSSNLYTMQLGLATTQGQYLISWNAIMAYSLLSIAAPLILFLIFQKLFMRGITAGGLKF